MSGLVRVLLGLVVLAAPSAAGATMLWNSGGGVTAKTCSAGDFFTAVDGSGNFTCSTASGSGDVTAVGDCASGACFDGTTGNSLQFEGATADGFETTLTATDPTADRTATLPNFSGTIAMERVYDVRAYGAKCDDSTNDAAAIQAAIDAAEATGQGGVVEFPAGICITNSALTVNEPGITLRGQGAATGNNATVLQCNFGTGTCVEMQSACTGCGVERMIVAARTAPTTLTLISGTTAEETFVRNVNSISDRYCVGIHNVRTISYVHLFFPVAGPTCRGVSLQNMVVVRINNLTGSIANDIDGFIVHEQTGVPGTVPDTLNLTDVVVAQGGAFSGAALKIQADDAANPPRWIQVTNAVLEARTTGAVEGDYPIYLKNVRDFKCSSCYVQGGYNAVRIEDGPGPITFAASVIGNSQREAIYHDADAITTLVGTTVSDASQVADNTYSDVYLSANSRGFSMIGGAVGAELLAFPGNDPKYGIEVAAGADEYRFSNVNCSDVPDSGCASGLTPAAVQVAFADGTAYADSDWSNYVLVRAPSLAANWTLTLPTTDGNANEFLRTDGSGVATWAAETGDISAVGNCTAGACFTGSSGSTLTASSGPFNLDSPGNIYATVDSDANETSAFVIDKEAGTAIFEVNENGTVYLYSGMNLRLYETDNTNYVQLSAPTLSANWTLTLPADDGNSGQFLQTDGSGTTTWATPSGSGNVSNTGTPADNQVAVWTDATTIEGTSGLTFSAGTLTATTFSGALSGNATTATTAGAGDSATAFFSSGTIEAARLPDADDDATTKGIITLPNAQFDCTAGSCSIATGGIGSTELADTFSATTITSNLVGNVTGNADTATLAATATTANAGDSATSFFSSGELERTLLPAASADCSANQFAKGVDADFVLDCAQPDHGGLAGLSDDDHTQYLALAGRTLSDPGGGVTTIATQTTSSPLAMTNASGFKWLNWDADLTVPNISLSQIFSVNGSLDRTGTTDSLYQFTGFHMATEFTSSTANGPLFQDAFFDASVVNQVANTGTQNTYQPISFLSKPAFKASSGATLTIGQTTGVDINPSWGVGGGGTLTNTTFSAFKLHTPNEIGGTLSLPTYIALDVEDLDTAGVTTPLSLRSVGTTTEMRHAGAARFGATGAVTSGKKLDVQGDAYIGGYLDIGDDIADLTTNTVNVVDIAPTVDISSTGQIVGVSVAPTTSATSGGDLTGIKVAPAWTNNGASTAADIQAVWLAGTYAAAQTSNISSAYVLRHDTAYSSATAGSAPILTTFGVYDFPTMTLTAASGTGTASTYAGVYHAPSLTLNSGGGATATFSLTEDVGLKMSGSYTKTAGTALNITSRIGLLYNEVTTSGTVALTDNIAVDVKPLTKGGTTNAALRSAVAAGSNQYFLKDDGGAQSKFTGKITTYNNVAADTSHSGVPFTIASATATNQSANIGSTNLIASATAGRYRICGFITLTTAAGTSSTLPALAIGWTDVTDSHVKAFGMTTASTANLTSLSPGNCTLIDAKGSTAITYSTSGYASNPAAAMKFKVYLTAEAM